MTVAEFIVDLQHRIEANGGNPVVISGQQMHALCYLRGSKHEGFEALVGRKQLTNLRRLQQRIEQAMVEQVAFYLTPVPWVTKTGTALEVSQMTDSHLRNTVDMIQEGRMRRVLCSGLVNSQWLRIFENELLVRAANQDIGR